MTTPNHKKLFSLSLAVLLFLPAIPAAAGSSAGGGIDLRLEQVLAMQGATFELGEIAGGDDLGTRPDRAGDRQAVPESNLEKADVASLADSSRVREVAAKKRLADQARGNRGFGGWLKKYWYVPVLAAAVAVAVSDDTDNPDDPD